MRDGGRAVSDGLEDQVARRIRLCERYPGLAVYFDRETGWWNASWPDGSMGTRQVEGYELRFVLDEAEKAMSS